MADQGTVTQVEPLMVRLDASTSTVPSNHLGSYSPVLGDRVMCDTVGKQLLVIGATSDSPTRYPGEIIAGGWLVAPPGTLSCDGASVPRATYPALFTAIGTQYGAVDGTHFSLPNFPSGTYLTGGTPGATSGSATHVLTTTEMPSHTHALGSHTHQGLILGGSTGYSHVPGDGAWNFAQLAGINSATPSIANTGGGTGFPLAPLSVGVRFVIKT